MGIWSRIAWGAALVCVAPAALAAQDSVTVAAGARYQAGGLKRLFLGKGYRAAWAAPVRVPVLDLRGFAGGLTPTEEGGGKATESLRFRGADGHEYVFRAVDKLSRRALPEDLQGSIVETIGQDLTSAKHPAAALAIPPILDAMGILHVSPALYVMPDDPRLGDFRQKWRGRLGQVEERLENDLAGVIFPGADDMESTDDFLDELEEDPRNRVDAHEYLKARLVDLWIGDWDRHPDQWRWVRFDRDGERVWRPVPRDRDNAFVRYEGLVMMVARSQRPNLVRFSPRIGPIYPMHYHSSETDRKLLALVPRAEWDAVTSWVQLRLTDELIDRALGRLPPEYRQLDAAGLRAGLRARRDQLPAASAGLYELVASEAEVHGTDEAEVARVTRRPDGAVEVEIAPRRPESRRLARRRTFLPGETKEVRVFLHGGDDELRVEGPAGGAITLRVIGGGGDDRLEETARGGSVARFYDHRGDNEIVGGRVDTRDWETPSVTPIGGDPRDPRDYGGETSFFSPTGRWQANVGPVIGVGPSFTRFGFRKLPFASLLQLRAVYAPLVPHGYGAELWGVLRRTGRPAHLTLSLRANRFESWRFHGFGNDSPPGEDPGDFVVRHDFVGAEVLYHDSLAAGWTVAAGPTAAWRQPHPGFGDPASIGVPGGDTHLMGGARLRIGWDRRDTLAVTRRGSGWTAQALGAAWDDGAPYARVSTEARVYLPLMGGGPSLALRGGAEHALGDFPFQDAAMLGGERLRGYPVGRFLGESAYWSSAELRQPLGTVRLLVRGRLGAIALVDVGMVEVDGETSDDAHVGYGGGLWFETLGKVGSLTYAYGDAGRLYFTLGLPF